MKLQQSFELSKITLPENIKIEVKNNSSELKELLKDDQNFLIKLVTAINSFPPSFVRNIIFEHYDNLIQESKSQHKPWPKIVDEVDRLTYSLYSLWEIDNKLFCDNFKNLDFDSYNVMSRLIKDEIVLQFKFTTDIDYNYDYNVDEYHILGELPLDLNNEEFN